MSQTTARKFRRDLDLKGFAVIPDVIESSRCNDIAALVRERGDSDAGSRRWLSESWCQALAMQLAYHPPLSDVIPASYCAAQCTLFEKSPGKNWLVSLHQDLSIPVKERVAGDQLRGWSAKEGGIFVQPPVELLGQLVAVRVHLDSSGPEAGELRVVPSSHRHGRLDAVSAGAVRKACGEWSPAVGRGGVLVMRPLLLHASSKMTVPAYRRVLHFLFGPRELPLGLAWPDQRPARDL